MYINFFRGGVIRYDSIYYIFIFHLKIELKCLTSIQILINSYFVSAHSFSYAQSPVSHFQLSESIRKNEEASFPTPLHFIESVLYFLS